jgi:hypothetical protein
MENQFTREFMLAERFSAFHPSTTPVSNLIDDQLVSDSVLCNVTGNLIPRKEIENLYSKAFEDDNAKSQIFTLFTAASHGALWRKVSSMPVGSIAMILEDDVMFLVKDFWEKIHLSLEHLPENYDIAFFAYWQLCGTPINDFFSVPSKEKDKCNLWTNCYVISQQGAKKLFNMFFPYNRTSGIDVDMRERYDEFNVYFSNIEFATQRRDLLHKAGHPVFFSARDVFSENKHKIKRPPIEYNGLEVVTLTKKNYIASSIFTTCKDPANEYKEHKVNFKSLTILDQWYRSGERLCKKYNNIQMVVLYDQLSEDVMNKCNSNYIKFIKVDDCALSDPYIYRWVVYRQFLEKNAKSIENIFFTDLPDVVIKQNPFLHVNKDTLYLGDQPEPWWRKWLKTRTMYYAQRIEDMTQIYNKWRHLDVLNAGILGGHIELVISFVNKMAEYIEKTADIESGTDMILFNYIARKYFNNIKHGEPVNSVFWKYQASRDDVWFIHK